MRRRVDLIAKLITRIGEQKSYFKRGTDVGHPFTLMTKWLLEKTVKLLLTGTFSINLNKQTNKLQSLGRTDDNAMQRT